MKISELMKYVLVWAWGFSLSLVVYPLYTEGDLVIYREYYLLIVDLNLENLLRVLGFFGSYDISFPAFYWPFAYIGMSHFGANSVINGFFCILLYEILVRHHASRFLVISIFINYYTLVLMFPAERSKVAFIFVMLAVLSKGSSVYKYLILAIFAHLQSVFYFLSYYSSKQAGFVSKLINGYVPVRELSLISGLLFVLSIFVWLNYPVLLNKFEIYESSLISDLPKSILLFGIACYLTKERLRMVLLVLPLFVSILLIGGETRLYMISFYATLYFLIKYGVVSTKIFYCWLIFYDIKTYSFIFNIFNSGQGFG
jgi:hypothetical protein